MLLRLAEFRGLSKCQFRFLEQNLKYNIIQSQYFHSEMTAANIVIKILALGIVTNFNIENVIFMTYTDIK